MMTTMRKGAASVGLGLLLAAVGCHRGSGRGTAAEHLPAGCDVAVRIGVKSLLALDETRQHAAELKKGAEAPATSNGRAFFAEFLQAAAVDPAKDLDEVAVCLQQKAGTGGDKHVAQLIAISGNLTPGKLPQAILSHAPAGRYESVKLPGLEAIRKKGGRYIAQAPDGTILIGDDTTLIVAARNASKERASSYGLDGSEVSLFAGHEALATLRANGANAQSPHPVADLLADAEKLEMRLDAREGLLRASVVMPAPDKAARAVLTLSDLFGTMKDGPGVPQIAAMLPPGTLDAIAAVRVTQQDRSAVLQTHLPKAALNDLFHQAAMLAAFGG
jgi:hypothetical protein